MSERLAVVIDIDKTVFPTWHFAGDIAQALEAGFGINSQSFNDQIDGRHIGGVGNLRHYDFFNHVAELGLDPDEVERYILETFSERDYVYADVSAFLDFLENEVKPDMQLLLTYGENRTQLLKYKCSPSLARVACVTTLESKDLYVANNLSDYTGIIIDDKVIEGLPANFTHLHIDRSAQPAIGTYASLAAIEQDWSEISASLQL